MSRVIPADKSKQLVLVIGPLSLPRSGASAAVTLPAGGPTLPSSSERPRAGLRAHQLLSSRAEPLSTSVPASTASTSPETERDPHNEVERRRKLRISQNIKTLAETLTPPCHCGRTTRAEILEMVVNQIQELQQKNSVLESQLKDLHPPTTTNREELSRRAIVLVEENLRLRVLLLAAVSCDKSPDRSASPSAVVGQVEVREGDEEEPGMADGLGEGGAEEASLPLPSEMTVEADGGVCSTNADSSVDDQEREDVSGATEEPTEKETSSGGGREEREKGGDLGFEEPEERDGLGSERNSSSNREGGAGNEDIGSGGDGEQVEGEKEHDKRIEVRETANTGEKENNKEMEVRELANWDGESSAAVDQSWPISSLLSDQTRSGPPPPPPPPREHQMAAFGLPILSPTYIAEHCSTSGSDQQFFGPTTTAASLPPVTSYTSVADTRPVSSQNSPLFAGGLPISRVTEFSRSQLATVSYSSLSVLSASSSSLHCSNSPQQISLAASLRPPPTRQSIVQPWVGTHSSSGSGPLSTSRRSSVVSRSSTTTTSQTANDQHGLLLRPQPESATTPSPGFHRGALPMTHQATTPRQSRYSSRTSHSIPSTRASRTVSSRGHAHTPYYLDRSRHNVHHNLSSVEVASVGGFPPSSQSLGHANLSFDGRGQSYCPGGVPSLLPSTAAPFHGYTSGPMPHQSRQPPGFSTSSIDPYYHCTVYQSQQSSSFSFLPPPHGHISPGSRHSQFTPHHPHQHNYTTLPPPPPFF